ncbi:hypothetical protein MTP99_007495 [Tenebrio molitor]|nr:hypothetical protein MTP99_007495 [Tenebrio molitor]
MRRKKSSLSEVKVAVIGAPGVGKTALSVRFLTKRYIGEYDHQSESRYKHEVLVDNEPVLYEILDTCPKNEDDLPSTDIINWADGLLFVYSVTDKCSFTYLKRVGSLITDSDIPVYIVANKNDMVHLREVSAEEGAMYARDLECGFSEAKKSKVILIMGISGAMRRDGLTKMSIDDIKDEHSVLIVAVPDTKTGIKRTFTVTIPEFDRKNMQLLFRVLIQS